MDFSAFVSSFSLSYGTEQFSSIRAHALLSILEYTIKFLDLAMPESPLMSIYSTHGAHLFPP